MTRRSLYATTSQMTRVSLLDDGAVSYLGVLRAVRLRSDVLSCPILNSHGRQQAGVAGG